MAIDRKFTVVVTICLAWALLVSLIFYRMSSGKSGGSNSDEKPMVVAVQPMGLGAVVTPETVKIVKVPANAFPKTAFSKLEDVVNRAVTNPILVDEPLIEGRLALRGSGPGLATLIPAGMRAMAIRVNDVVGVAGFVLPGMKVDLLVTGRPPGSAESMTSTVLQNVTVLSVGQTIQTDGKSQTINAPVVTLLVSPAQAEALTLANNEGRIQLALRNSGDTGHAPTTGQQLSALYMLGRPPVPPPAAAPPPAPARPVRPVIERRPAKVEPKPPEAAPPQEDPVTVIRGNLKSVETVRRVGGPS